VGHRRRAARQPGAERVQARVLGLVFLKYISDRFETVYDLHLAHIELLTWAGAHRLRFPSTQLPWCHMISEAQYLTLADTTDYTAR